MRPRLHKHLVKPLIVRNGPEGLYPEPLFWMEGKDMEGFNACFSYGFVKKPGVCHPMEGAVVHPYDECLVFASTDLVNFRNLGGEISIELGEEREEYVFNEPTVVCIPKGLVHGPIKYRRVDRPFVHYTISLAPQYQATVIPPGELAPVSKGTKYQHLVKPLIDAERMKKNFQRGRIGTNLDYETDTDEYGVVRAVQKMGPGNADSLVWLFGDDLEGFELNFTWGHYSQCGKWHRRGEVHSHPEEEILIFVGLDPDNLEYLGAEVEQGMGYEGERHIVNVPSAYICPKGFPHLPMITRWVDKPYGFIVCCLDEGHDSPWVEVNLDE
ncbi:MAG: hypothetical protein GX044_08165 [Firmicutes bacterium]|nr:hypothetical protein [Bacillota bacterium]